MFMDQPEAFIDCDFYDHLCKLLKALYVLKQAPQHWFAKIYAPLYKLYFQRYTYDHCFHVNSTITLVIMITLYVHDVHVDQKSLQDFDEEGTCKQIRNGGFLGSKYFLGLQIIQNVNVQTHKLSQSSYAENFLQRFGMNEFKAVCNLFSGDRNSIQSLQPLQRKHKTLHCVHLLKSASGLTECLRLRRDVWIHQSYLLQLIIKDQSKWQKMREMEMVLIILIPNIAWYQIY